MSENNILEIKNLKKYFDDQEAPKTVLEDFSLSLKSHEFLTVLGPSGCGKTTLLRCIAGFEQYEGQILVNGELKDRPGTDRIMVFQDFNQLFPWKTVEKNIQFPLKLKGIKDKAELQSITAEVLSKVGLEGTEKYYPRQLSGGMKQRVAIAKAIALKPRIILMDEPFAALDAITRNNLQAELKEIYNSEDITVIFITHNIQEAIVLGSRVMVLQEKGMIVEDMINPLKKPVSPSSPGYGELWEKLRKALYVDQKAFTVG